MPEGIVKTNEKVRPSAERAIVDLLKQINPQSLNKTPDEIARDTMFAQMLTFVKDGIQKRGETLSDTLPPDWFNKQLSEALGIEASELYWTPTTLADVIDWISHIVKNGGAAPKNRPRRCFEDERTTANPVSFSQNHKEDRLIPGSSHDIREELMIGLQYAKDIDSLLKSFHDVKRHANKLERGHLQYLIGIIRDRIVPLIDTTTRNRDEFNKLIVTLNDQDPTLRVLTPTQYRELTAGRY
jgi:hypothetical protein